MKSERSNHYSLDNKASRKIARTDFYQHNGLSRIQLQLHTHSYFIMEEENWHEAEKFCCFCFNKLLT